MPHLFCFGYGYTAQALGKQLLEQGWHVSGTTRSDDKAHRLRQQGIHALIWEGDTVLPSDALADVTHILQSISPSDAGDNVMAICGEQLAQQASIIWAGYLSTTGVYGHHEGAWVDEATPLTPTNERGQQRVIAEDQWLSWGIQAEIATHIFRLSGIYGAHRNALTKVKNGTARRIASENQYFSRIHVDDIASVLQASIERPQAGEIYNLADDMPASGADVTAYASALLGIAPPPLQTIAEADLSPMARSFYRNSKRVRNDKIKQQLGVSLAFPTYKIGLRQLFEDGEY